MATLIESNDKGASIHLTLNELRAVRNALWARGDGSVPPGPYRDQILTIADFMDDRVSDVTNDGFMMNLPECPE
jgi:hypothetical protein